VDANGLSLPSLPLASSGAWSKEGSGAESKVCPTSIGVAAYCALQIMPDAAWTIVDRPRPDIHKPSASTPDLQLGEFGLSLGWVQLS
jgi:hypothetical protein